MFFHMKRVRVIKLFADWSNEVSGNEEIKAKLEAEVVEVTLK